LVRMDMEDTPSTDGKTGTAAEDIMTKKSEAARRFQRSAAPFILATAIPYMLQIILYGNMNFFAFQCLKHDLHRAVRLNELFDHESRLAAVSNNSATSPDMYASSMDTIVTTVYDFCNRKMFSLPKLLLLPTIIMRQPLMVAQITPFIFASDFLKGKVMTYLTTNIERLQKEALEVTAIRTKVEAFDMKNAELLQRSGSGATKFTQKRWEELTVSIQAKTFMASFLERTKSFFNWIQHHFVFSVMIDCALAQLLAIGKIVSAEIFVFSRAIEDAVDTVLMRSRAEAELARMLTKITKLKELADVWERSSLQNPLPCTVAPTSEHAPGIVLRNLQYSRGTASVRVDHFDIKPGVYALTGSNGSGKSTLFRLLMSCSSNEKRVDLPPSIVMSSVAGPLVEESDMTDKECSGIDEVCPPEDEKAIPADSVNHHPPKLNIVMPSNNVVEISQTFYWPLYTKPIDWIYQHHHVSDKMLSEKTQKVAELLQDLEFMQANPDDEAKAKESNITDIAPPGDAVSEIIHQLHQVKEDWFNDLSGGQKSKVELVRKVNIQLS
jgi:energy-coupling factor transporter ATP-binding protein EcfA2